MALTKTWYCNANAALADTTTTTKAAQSIFFAIKELMIGNITGTTGSAGPPPASSNWTVDLSCDSVTTGSADYLVAYTNVVRGSGGAVRSWVVLKSPTGVSPLTYMCMHYNGAGDGVIETTWSHSAFIGGSTTARPTSDRELAGTGYPSSLTFGDISANTDYRATRVCDALGNFHILISRTGLTSGATTFFGIQMLSGARANDNSPIVYIAEGNNTECAQGQSVCWSAGSNGGSFMQNPVTDYSQTGGTNSGFWPRDTYFLNTMTVANDTDGGWACLPVAYWGTNAYPVGEYNHSLRGYVPDWYMTNNGPVSGDYIAGSLQQQVGNLLLPTGGILHNFGAVGAEKAYTFYTWPAEGTFFEGGSIGFPDEFLSTPGSQIVTPASPAVTGSNDPPQIINFSPLTGTFVLNNTPISFDVVDDSGQFTSIALLAKFPSQGIYEVIHDGTNFGYSYNDGSTRVPLTGGFSYSLTRNDGWPGDIEILPLAVDTSGSINP